MRGAIGAGQLRSSENRGVPIRPPVFVDVRISRSRRALVLGFEVDRRVFLRSFVQVVAASEGRAGANPSAKTAMPFCFLTLLKLTWTFLRMVPLPAVTRTPVPFAWRGPHVAHTSLESRPVLPAYSLPSMRNVCAPSQVRFSVRGLTTRFEVPREK